MPWCLKCSCEYSVGERKCSGCGSPLPRSSAGHNIKVRNARWTAIREVNDAVQAELMKNFLRTNGFDVTLRNGEASGASPRQGEAGRDVIRIFVPAESASAAALVLHSGDTWGEEDCSASLADEQELDDEDYLDDEGADLIESDEFLEGMDTIDDEEEEYY